MSSEVPILTLDGPSGSGKGTIAQALAGRLGWHYLESGALYRVMGLLADRNGIALDDITALVTLADELELTFVNGKLFLRNEEIGDEIRTEQCGDRASRIAPLPEVRSALLKWQQRCARLPGLVADGRDMGTVVFPAAGCKIFLTASAEERAKRRFNQLREKGFDVNIRRLFREIRERDRRDSTRLVSPLRPANDAFELDTTGLSINEVIAVVSGRVSTAYHLHRSD